MRVITILAASYTLAAGLAVYGKLDAALPLLCAVSVLAALLFAWKRSKLGRRGTVALLCALGLALGFGWTAGHTTLFLAPARELSGQTVYLSARVLQFPQEGERGCSVLVRTKTPSGVGVDTLLYLDEQGLALRPGDEIQSVVRLTLADHTYAGDEITYYTAKGVFLRGKAYGTLTVDRPERPPLSAAPALLSKALEESITAAFPEGIGAEVLAIVTGNRSDLSQPFATSLRRAGLSHTAAVSGMHLSFLAGFLTCLLGKHHRRTSLAIMPVVVLFMLTAGCTPSVVRATVMLLMLLAAPLFGRERDDLTALGTALLVLLIQNPLAVTHVGLQLSFGAVAGIFLVSEPIQCRLYKLLHIKWAKPWTLKWALLLVPRYLVATLAASLGASVFTVPLCALHFSSVSLLAPISNLVTLWTVSFIFCGGLLVGLLGLASAPAATLLGMAVTPFVQYMDWAVSVLSRFTFAAITMESFYYKAWVILLSAVILAALVMKKGRRLVLPSGVGVITLSIALLFTALDFHLGSMAVTALDVGQGQSVLIRQGSFLTLVDCGGDSFDSAGDIAADHIQNAGRASLDLLVLTHFHDDHANGVPQLLERLEVKTLVMPDELEDTPLRREILALAEKKGVECITITEDRALEWEDGRRIQFFAPLGSSGANERCLTVLAQTGEFDVLITGDMGEREEALLLRHTQLPDIELLVAGHHGSKYATSQALLDAVCPELAIISVGRDNFYGHPAPETLERLRGVDCYRTDQHGTVQVRVSDKY